MIDRKTHEQNIKWWKSENPFTKGRIPDSEWEKLYELGNSGEAGKMIYTMIIAGLSTRIEFIALAKGFDWDSIYKYKNYLEECVDVDERWWTTPLSEWEDD